MLLRKITKHVEGQNGFAVGIDFLIVVFGVFIGIQVANWNVVRADRADNVRYMQRLHDDVVTGEAANVAASLELDTTVKLLAEVAHIISADELADGFTQDQCDAVFAAHIYRPGRVSIPTLEELIASGRGFVIADVDLRKTLMLLS